MLGEPGELCWAGLRAWTGTVCGAELGHSGRAVLGSVGLAPLIVTSTAMQELLQPICASLQRLQPRTCPWIAHEEPHGHISTALYMEKWKRVLDTVMQCCL